MTATHNDEPLNQTVSSGRADLGDLRGRLTAWLAGRPEVAGGPTDGGGVEVGEVTRPFWVRRS